jgi:hypothetical protein
MDKYFEALKHSDRTLVSRGQEESSQQEGSGVRSSARSTIRATSPSASISHARSADQSELEPSDSPDKLLGWT